MTPAYHVASSALLAGGIGAGTGRWDAAAAAFITGVFVDVDHFVDYLFAPGRKWSFSHFWVTFHETRLKYAVLFLHSWELLAAVLLAAIITGKAWIWGIAMGGSLHMIVDLFGNWTVAGYSLCYRASQRFRPEKLFKETNSPETDAKN